MLIRDSMSIISLGLLLAIFGWAWDARLIRWIRQPLDRLAEPEITEIHTLSRDKSLSTQSQAWIAFLLELVQFKHRFDILLDEAGKIQLTEFDIEL